MCHELVKRVAFLFRFNGVMKRVEPLMKMTS